MYSNYDYTAPNDYRSYLAHHGVKGMRWGVRKQRKPSLRRFRKDREKFREEAKQVHKKELNEIEKSTDALYYKNRNLGDDGGTNFWSKKDVAKLDKLWEKRDSILDNYTDAKLRDLYECGQETIDSLNEKRINRECTEAGLYLFNTFVLAPAAIGAGIYGIKKLAKALS